MKNKRSVFTQAFESLPDPRRDSRKSHKLSEVLFIALCTLLTGGRSFYDMEACGRGWLPWFKKHLQLKGGPPSHDTFNRVFQMIDPERFEECFRNWVLSLRQDLGREVIAVDGKTHRRTGGESGSGALQVVNAWASENRLVLGQLAVERGSNEIKAVPELLKVLMLKGCVVTADAMNTQKETVETIVSQGADYVLALKRNHSQVYEEVKLFMDELSEKEASHVETLDKGHGRLEERRYWQSEEIDWFEDRGKWLGLKSFGMVESCRETGGGVRKKERRYYISSLSFEPKLFAYAVREHWGIENQVHWSLDVIYGEDQSRARTKNAAKNLGTLRNMALNIVRADKSKAPSLRNKMYSAFLNPDLLVKWLRL
jgi:predicted transposase YbfD/YdcC